MKYWSRWRSPDTYQLPAELKSWLTDTGSLTRRLQQHVQAEFRVSVLQSEWQRPLPDEALLLGQHLSQFCFQRAVQLLDGERAQVYARTLIPIATYQAMRHRFEGLGSRPLGEMLFTEPSLTRGRIEVARLKPGEKFYEMAVKQLKSRPAILWGRRSCFYLDGKILLVNEIFLPEHSGVSR